MYIILSYILIFGIHEIINLSHATESSIENLHQSFNPETVSV